MSQMSSGQILGSVAGAVIGGIIGNVPGAMIGASLGGLIGGWIDPPPAPEPPPAGNMSLNSYVHNAPVPLAYGQNKIYGGCLWIGDINVTMREGGSKKSPEYTPNMSLEFAIGICEGPVISFEQYWFNEHNNADPPDDMSEGMRFEPTEYLGTGSQSADPDMASYLSGTNAPATGYIYTAYFYVDAHIYGGYFNSIPNCAVDAKCLLTESGEKDANPIRCLYDFLTNERYGVCIDTALFDGDPDTVDTSWYTASAYCDEIVSYEDGDGATINEPRFRYSNIFNQRVSGFDIIKDMVQSCRAILSWSQGLLFVKIENGNETVDGYFTDEYIVELIATGSSTVDRIYFTTSISESSGFWEAAIVSFKVGERTIEEVIDLQGTDYVDVIDSLPQAPTNGTTIKLTKDNIKEGTFNWNKTSKRDKKNSVRIEFINRTWYDEEKSAEVDEYQWDVVEHEEPSIYADDPYIGQTPNESNANEIQIRLGGVKRKSQAMRMAKWYAEFNTYIDYYCEFCVDHIGYLYKIGDIIGVSHSQMGWVEKKFRIVGMEEIENDEIKFMCLEYNENIYSDDIGIVYTTGISQVKSVLDEPPDLGNFHAVQDETENRIYLLSESPSSYAWFIGTRVYYRTNPGDAYQYLTQYAELASNVKLLSAINATQTVIPFDSTTLFGSFPSAGEFWIDDELISYTSIDDINDEFEGCVRGSNASTHDATDYCWLKENTTPYFNFSAADIGQTYYLLAVAYNVVGITSDKSSGKTFEITLS